MIIRSKDIYNDYLLNHKKEYVKLRNALTKLNRTIINKKQVINAYSYSKYGTELSNVINCRVSKKLFEYNDSDDAKTKKEKYNSRLYIELKTQSNKYKAELKKMSKTIHKVKVINFILSRFFHYITKEIIENTYIFEPGFNLGRYMIIRKKRTRKMINWGESNRIKDQLIKEGKTPYNAETNPNGEKWLVYFDSPYQSMWNWGKRYCRITNKSMYEFSPSVGKVGNVSKLYKFIKQNPLKERLYPDIFNEDLKDL